MVLEETPNVWREISNVWGGRNSEWARENKFTFFLLLITAFPSGVWKPVEWAL